MMFAFVTRDGADILQEVVVPCGGCDTSLETLPCVPSVFGHRVVFGFFVGQFTADEVNLFMVDLAAAPGTSPMANDYLNSTTKTQGSTLVVSHFKVITVCLRGFLESLTNTDALSSSMSWSF